MAVLIGQVTKSQLVHTRKGISILNLEMVVEAEQADSAWTGASCASAIPFAASFSLRVITLRCCAGRRLLGDCQDCEVHARDICQRSVVQVVVAAALGLHSCRQREGGQARHCGALPAALCRSAFHRGAMFSIQAKLSAAHMCRCFLGGS